VLALFGPACVLGRLEPEDVDTLASRGPEPAPSRECPVDTSEGSTPVSNQAAAVLIVAIALLGFYPLVGYIVHKTGTTAGIADIGRAVADIIRAVAAVISAAFTSRSP
jgi:hypothetical protein